MVSKGSYKTSSNMPESSPVSFSVTSPSTPGSSPSTSGSTPGSSPSTSGSSPGTSGSSPSTSGSSPGTSGSSPSTSGSSPGTSGSSQVTKTNGTIKCGKVDCDGVGEDNVYNCCYNIPSKIQEFLQKDTYMLDYKNTIKRDDNNDRIKVLYSKLFQAYNVMPNKKIDKEYKEIENGKDPKYREYNQKYFNTFGIIPLELIPASYIPFNYKNYEMNLDRLSKGEIFFEDDYKKIFIDYNKQPDPNNTNYINEKSLKEYLAICLRDRLGNPKSVYNAFSINIMALFVGILWIFIIVMMLYILFYYYRDIYSYILLGITILLVLIAVIWKMFNILNID